MPIGFLMKIDYVTIILFLLTITSIIVVSHLWRTRWRYWREYWDNGSMKCRYFLDKKGEKIGEETLFFYDGRVNKTQFWENGKLNGIAVIFYKTGERYIQSHYKDNKRSGEYIIYAKNGAVIQSCVYQDGEKIAEGTMQLENISVIQREPPPLDFHSIIRSNIRKSYESAKSAYGKVMAEIEKEEAKRAQRHELMKMASVVLGGQGIHDKLTGDKIVEACNAYQGAAEKATQQIRGELEEEVKNFGELRIAVMSRTTGRFLGFLKRIKQKNAEKEYEMLRGIGVDFPALEKMEQEHLSGKQLTAAGAGAAVLAVALRGAAPALLGAAASGALVLGGIFLTAHFASKRTEIEEKRCEVEEHIAGLERQWVTWDGVNRRAAELSQVTRELEGRVVDHLDILEPLLLDDDSENSYYVKVFQQTGMLIKAITELLQAPLVDDKEQASEQSDQIIQKTNKILNTKFISYD